MTEWDKIPREEQETLINIDYYSKEISLFTTREAVAKKLYRELGTPHKVQHYKGKTASIEYTYPLSDSKLNKLLYKTIVIGNVK